MVYRDRSSHQISIIYRFWHATFSLVLTCPIRLLFFFLKLFTYHPNIGCRWIIGGRMRPGETVQTSIKRLLAREWQFQLEDLTRVRTVAHYTYCFDRRNEPPQENGNADLAAILTIQVTNEECASLKDFDVKEYEAGCWVHPVDILLDSFGSSVPIYTAGEHHPPPQSTIEFHPALKRASRDLLAMQAWDKIEGLQAKNEASEVCKLLSTYMLLKSSTPLSKDFLVQYAR
eukprot:Phypoly_transcript_12733.p1 GENE.Phypoly_transcript_12733~~Phypoly_transcript_12733.p1  ORF type:complete len:230 (+),score=9.83 Phypoly_transcript_12733:390-1079(+)